MNSVVDCQWGGETLQLLPDCAVFWPARKTLIIADPHFGKPSAFRKAGIPVPAGTTASDLQRLDSLIGATGAKHLVVLGDFFHHRTGQCDRTMEMLGHWRAAQASVDITVVMGNHDRSSEEPPAHWDIRYSRRPVKDGPFLYCHEPCEHAGLFVLSGHIHPSIKLYDGVGHALRLPCFLFSSGYALLPAFGGFTGTASVKPRAGDKVFAIADCQIFSIPVTQRA